jgi:hypothetical protein
LDKVWAEEAAEIDPRAWSSLGAVRDSRHMAHKVRALSYRVPLFVRFGDRGFTFSISGWHGVV